MNSDRPLWRRDRGRTVHRFRPTEFRNGSRRIFAVGVFRNCPRPNPRTAKEAVFTVPDRWDALTVVNLLMTENGWPPRDWELVTTESLTLANGRQIWLVSNVEQIDHGEPEPVPDGNIIQIRDPDEHDVACPGFLLRPFFLG